MFEACLDSCNVPQVMAIKVLSPSSRKASTKRAMWHRAPKPHNVPHKDRLCILR